MGGQGAPNEQRDAVRRTTSRNPFGAGRFWPIAASLVAPYAPTWLAPHS